MGQRIAKGWKQQQKLLVYRQMLYNRETTQMSNTNKRVKELQKNKRFELGKWGPNLSLVCQHFSGFNVVLVSHSLVVTATVVLRKNNNKGKNFKHIETRGTSKEEEAQLEGNG